MNTDIVANVTVTDTNTAADNLRAFGELIVYAVALVEETKRWWRSKQEAHHRKALLDAYKSRGRWKAADRARLQALGVSDLAMRRAEKAKGRGRPVVERYSPLEETIFVGIVRLKPIIDEKATPSERRHALRRLPGWKILIEATYRAEVGKRRARGDRDPSGNAERDVASVLCISESTVHASCHLVRRQRRLAGDLDDDFLIPLISLSGWIENGWQSAEEEDWVSLDRGVKRHIRRRRRADGARLRDSQNA